MYAQNQLEEAEFLFKLAVYTLKQLNDLEGISKISNNLGVLYGKLGRIQEAEEAFKDAESTGKEIEDKTFAMDAVINKGTLYLRLGKLEEALQTLNKGLQMAKNMDKPERYGQVQGNIGLSLLDLGRAKESLPHFEDAKAVFKKLGAEIEVAFSDENLGDAYRAIGDKEMAFSMYDNSIKLLERMRGNLVGESFKVSFQSHIENVYKNMIVLCFQRGQNLASYEYNERSRSRAFVDILATSDISPPGAIPGELCQQENDCLKSLRQVYGKQVPTRNLDTEELLRNQDSIYQQIEKIAPEYVFLRRGKPMTFAEVKSCLK